MFLFIKDYSLQLNINDSFIAHKNRRKEEAIFNFVGMLVVSLNLLLPDAFMKLSSEFLMNYKDAIRTWFSLTSAKEICTMSWLMKINFDINNGIVY